MDKIGKLSMKVVGPTNYKGIFHATNTEKTILPVW
jgi:hypothetical protein